MLGSLTNVPVPVEVYKMHLDLLKSPQMFGLVFHWLPGHLLRFVMTGFKFLTGEFNKKNIVSPPV